MRTRDRYRSASAGRLYRSAEDKVFFGICGGLAEHFDFSAWAVRLVFIASQLLFPWTFLAYLFLAFVIRKEPGKSFATDEQEEFWNMYQSSRHEALKKVNRAFQSLDKRLQRMERVVTNPEFDLRDDFRNL